MSNDSRTPVKPSQVSPGLSPFDRFAGAANTVVSRAPFFSFCVLLVILWAPTMFLLNVNTSQLIINTATTIITFLLVALLQNSQTRADEAVQQKLNALADGLADLMKAMAADKPELQHDMEELRAAVGVELRESA